MQHHAPLRAGFHAALRTRRHVLRNERLGAIDLALVSEALGEPTSLLKQHRKSGFVILTVAQRIRAREYLEALIDDMALELGLPR